MSGEELHSLLDDIERIHGLYSPVTLGSCGGACVLWIYVPAGRRPDRDVLRLCGCRVREFPEMQTDESIILLCFSASFLLSLWPALVYAGFLKIGEMLFGISIQHEAGYICAMLFIIPGFPFITSGIDLAKLDMRSGTERLMYALIIILVAAMSAWIMALLLHLKPVDFIKISLPVETLDPVPAFWPVSAACLDSRSCSTVRYGLPRLPRLIGAVANTLRLELVDLAGMPPAAAAFVGALTAGLLASMIKNKAGYPRISLTVPSIVIMVPGLYLYRGFYNLGHNVPFHSRLLVRRCHSDHSRPPSGPDLRKDPDRQNLPVLHVMFALK